MSPTRRAPPLGWSLAWKRLIVDSRDDLLPDPLEYDDYRANAAPIIESAKARFTAGYVPADLYAISVPKQGFSLRPGTTMAIEDRLVYQALIDKFARRVDSRLENEHVVCGYRVRQSNSSKYLFQHGITRWLKFRDEIRSGYEAGYRYLLNTDLVSYFDHINHRMLTQQLADHGVPKPIVDALRRLLSKWQTHPGIGIPQGHNPSSLLGNAYLDPVDKVMVREGYVYLRYVDDIYVFAKSRVDLKKALKLLTHELRALGLHIQEAKTKILEGQDIRSFIDKRQDQLQALDYAIAADLKPLALETIRGILKEMTPRKFDERHFRKCLNELKKLKSDLAVKRCLSKLETMPHAAREMSEYLSLFAHRKVVKSALIAFLQDADKNIYEWQEVWLLNALRNSRTLPRDFLNFCRTRTRTADHWVSRASYALLLGELGDGSDRQLVYSRLAHCANPIEKRAFIFAFRGMQSIRRNHLLNQIETADPTLAPACTLARAVN